MAVSDYSTNPADNATAGSVNFAEGQAPSTVNNSARQVMADIRGFYESIEWRDFGHTVTYTGSTTFTIAGDVTSTYTANRPIKCNDASTLYGIIASSSYAAPDTTVTVTLDSGSLSASLSSVELGVNETGQPIHVNALRGTLPVANGGTGTSSHTAYAVLCGGTTSGGAIQSIASVGTSGHVLTSNGAGSLPTFQPLPALQGALVAVTEFTSSGTWTKNADTSSIVVMAVGGGGGGGGKAASSYNAGGGGQAGEIKWYSSMSPPSSVTVTIGAGGAGTPSGSSVGSIAGSGGDTTFGALLTARGGKGGIHNMYSSMNGAPDGQSGYGLGGAGGTYASPGNGSNADANSGAGGGGAYSTTATAYAGGNGGSGLVIVWEFK